MAHDVAVNVFYTNRVKKPITENEGANDGTDTSVDAEKFDEEEKSEIINIVFAEMCDRLKS